MCTPRRPRTKSPLGAWLDVLLAGAGGMTPALAFVAGGAGCAGGANGGGGAGGAGGAGVLLVVVLLNFLLDGNV